MKRHSFLLFLAITAIVFASALPVQAIEFVAEDTYESVFIVRSGTALGSGFAIGSNCIVTNAHVLQDPKNVNVWSYDGSVYAAWVLGMDEDQDIAVLIVADVVFPMLEIADESSMRTGDDVYAIGAPKSMAYTLTKGVVSAKERQIGKYSYIQTDAPINEGNSGGPLLNALGQVLGMNTLKMDDSEGIGLAIPINKICAYLQTLGIELDDKGNVSATIEVPFFSADIPEEERQHPGDTDYEEPIEASLPISAITAFVIAGFSVVLNIILGIALLQLRQKDQSINYDPRERTDFDIDILE